MKGKTKSGFKFDVNEAMLDDWEVVEAVADMDGEDESLKIRGMVRFVSLVLGENKKLLIDHIRSKNDGACPSETMFSEVMEIINSVKEIKNSQSSQGS